MKDEQEYRFGILLQKDNPRPNAPRYRFETIAQIFDFLTEKNVDRFLYEFSEGMKIAVSMREATYEADSETTSEGLKMEYFEWIDD